MSRSERAIFTNMCMIYDDKGHVLVQDRISKTWPGITFPGGHIEKGESFVQAVVREVWEETGLTIKSPELCGIKQFQTNEDERYVVLLYKTNQFAGELISSAEGEVYWLPRQDLLNHKLAPDFAAMVQVMEDGELSEFFYEREAEQVKLHLF
ncbi:8-oxo-dGTP diphosphatase [Amphibacillus marinus]|uniref:8-oxo-dGTP diphosphatase n=1 Tax=Amphibacillus marinus TaxID=872970 RepID=A0A1H8L3P5_9BACI|nr:8-oxo-dGTP diphosphatase [Amphibacillus marinus]SEN99774.1 8-oxo-dGTP diphosphatase [Amphibacillus marinus]